MGFDCCAPATTTTTNTTTTSTTTMTTIIGCCYNATVGGEDFCTTTNPCGEDEGDCDSIDDCQDGLACGSNNCPYSLGFDSEVDCC